MYEIGIKKKDDGGLLVDFDDPILKALKIENDQVVGYLTEEQVEDYLKKIENYKEENDREREE